MRTSFFHNAALAMRLLHAGTILFTLAGAAYQFMEPGWAMIQGPTALVIILASVLWRGNCPLSVWEERLSARAGTSQPVGDGFIAYHCRRFGIDMPTSTWATVVWCFLFFSLGASSALLLT